MVSTSVGDIVNLPGQVQTLLVNPANAYFASTTTPTIQGLAAALQADPGTAGSVVGQFAHGEFLITLSAFKTSTAVTPALNLSEDTAGISLQVGTPPALAGQANLSLNLSFGYDTGTENTPNTTPTFFIQPGTITEGVSLTAAQLQHQGHPRCRRRHRHRRHRLADRDATVALKDPLAGDTTPIITPGRTGRPTHYRAGDDQPVGQRQPDPADHLHPGQRRRTDPATELVRQPCRGRQQQPRQPRHLGAARHDLPPRWCIRRSPRCPA